MSSGYTADLYDGKEKTFAEFTLGCARAFGALITMRDEPSDAPIPDEFEPSEWVREAVEKAKAALDEAERRSIDEWEDLEREDRDKTAKAIEDAARTGAGIRARYESMLAHVRGWEPPSADHQGLKDFMVKQLEESIRFDCSDLSDVWTVPSPRSPQSFRSTQLAARHSALERAEKSWAEELERVDGRNRWVRQLRESLGALDRDQSPVVTL